MIIKRNAYQNLLTWKRSSNRKPLIIRGARQVGKTSLVRQFAGEFDHFVELNMERETHRKLFEIDDVGKILNAAMLLTGVKNDQGSLLLFIDEIQESPKAIGLLRYFYEERPDVFVIAAGSLLEFALRKTASFPVGRVSYLYLSPVGFDEYLQASGNEQALDALQTIPIADYAHDILLEHFHAYLVTGGMPEVVSRFLETNNMGRLTGVYEDLWQSFADDIEKYASGPGERKVLRHILQTAAFEQDRIKFAGFGNSEYRSREVGEAMRALDMAGVIRLVYPTTSLAPPMITDLKKRPRLQFIDTGLLNHGLKLQAELLTLNDFSKFHRGKIVQHIVTQEIISTGLTTRYEPHFWVREERNSSAEVDLVCHFGKYLIPVEVKSGKTGTLRSLHQFIKRSNHIYAVRFFGGKYSIEETSTPSGYSFKLLNLPYYLGTQIHQYLAYFINPGSY